MRPWYQHKKSKPTTFDITIGWSQVPPTDHMLSEIDYLLEADTMNNISEDHGNCNEINNPQLFGFYKHSDDLPSMTLEEIGNNIIREERWANQYTVKEKI